MKLQLRAFRLAQPFDSGGAELRIARQPQKEHRLVHAKSVAESCRRYISELVVVEPKMAEDVIGNECEANGRRARVANLICGEKECFERSVRLKALADRLRASVANVVVVQPQ